jgi:hypothetical protein
MLIFRIRPIDSRHRAKSFSSRARRADAADITRQADAAAAAGEGERRNGVAREKTAVADLLWVVDSQALHITLTLTVT